MEYSRLPDLNAWATLRAVVERGGVTEAARLLHVGQPAVTKRLRNLERYYGTPLLQRVSGRLRLTPSGEKVYLLAVQTLDRHSRLQEELQQIASGETTMRLAVSFAIGEHLLPDLLLRFDAEHPQYRVESRVGYGRDVQTDLATDMADLALLEAAPDHPEILVQRWMDDELWMLCGPTHPFAQEEIIPVERLSELSYVLRERRSSIRDALDEALHSIGINQLNVAMEIGSSDAILEMLRHGKHVSFMPRFAVRERVGEGVLHRIKVRGFRIMRTLWICRNRSRIDHPVVEAFIQGIRRAVV